MSDADERIEHQIAPDDLHDWVQATALPTHGSRSADHWEPLGPIILAAGDYEQIAPRRPGRASLLISNTGGGDVRITRKRDGASPKRYVTINAGGSIAVDTEAPVYAYAVADTTIEILETMFAVPELGAANQLAVLTAAAQAAQ